MNDSSSHGQVLRIGDTPIELRLVALNPLMLRVTVVPLRAGDSPEPVPPAPEIIVHEVGSAISHKSPIGTLIFCSLLTFIGLYWRTFQLVAPTPSRRLTSAWSG